MVVVIEDCTTCDVAKSISPVFIRSITVSLLCPVCSAIARTVVFTLYLNATNLDIENEKKREEDDMTREYIYISSYHMHM